MSTIIFWNKFYSTKMFSISMSSQILIWMLTLGLYWILVAYFDWQEKPVLTSITTTAYSVKQVEQT